MRMRPQEVYRANPQAQLSVDQNQDSAFPILPFKVSPGDRPCLTAKWVKVEGRMECHWTF